ncbi:MAG: flagellar biosynthesis anti-sigma factor FlgM [Gammaproteobacteria bacterium]|nr:flagellar biosynthesis anti-sigma factor FlgM [Gammaproteobacteria bacterium]
MSKESLDKHQEKLKKLKQAIENNTFSTSSERIAAALLEAQTLAKQNKRAIKQPEIA